MDILPSGERAYGVTSLHNYLYVLRADRIDVYNAASSYKPLEPLRLAGLQSHECNDLTSSVLRNSLYVADCAMKLIRAVELGRSVVEWVVPDCPRGLSVTPNNDTLLVTCADTRQLLELSLDGGEWLDRVELPSDIQRPLHAVKLPTGHYVVSHSTARGLPGQHRVCLLESTGSILLSYGSQSGSGLGQLNWPCHVSADSTDDGEMVFVADSSNNRIVLLSGRMQFVRGYVSSVSHPCRLHLERATRRLYISEFGGRVVFIRLNDFLPSQHCHSARLLAEQYRSAQCTA